MKIKLCLLLARGQHRSLRALGFPGVPQAVQTELKGAYLANAWRNELFAEELARLLGLLGQAGISVIPLKGVALAQRYGPNGGLIFLIWCGSDTLADWPPRS